MINLGRGDFLEAGLSSLTRAEMTDERGETEKAGTIMSSTWVIKTKVILSFKSQKQDKTGQLLALVLFLSHLPNSLASAMIIQVSLSGEIPICAETWVFSAFPQSLLKTGVADGRQHWERSGKEVISHNVLKA